MQSRPSSEEALVMWYRSILITRRYSQVRDKVAIHVAQQGCRAIVKKFQKGRDLI